LFTGLVETIGTVANVSAKGDIWQLDIFADKIARELHVGDSVSISGACNTVIKFSSDSFSVEMMEETRKRTKLASLRSGSHVNLERAMRLDSRLDGHLVAGHVDGIAEVIKIEIQPNTRQYFFSAPANILSGIVPKGSVTVDGVSLTVIHAGESSFSVGVIPTTLENTTIKELKVGDKVNIETDMLGKYILKFMEARFSDKDDSGEAKNSLTWDKLAEYGWA
jgi:riboflavin synthase